MEKKIVRTGDRIVYSHKVAGALLDMGFELVEQKRNSHDLTKYVYFFKRTDGLEEAIAELTRK